MLYPDIELPMRNRVYQRDENGTAAIPFNVHSIARARVLDASGRTVINWHDTRDAVKGVPTGGPYTVEIETRSRKTIAAGGIMVGDLWILAGQSNMDGCGKLVDLEAPSRMVRAFYYNEYWDIAKDPLCVLVDSIDPVHWPCPEKDLPAAREDDHRYREYGAGLGVRFGKALNKATGVPIGLIVCSHGGTSIEQWDPALKDQGGQSLYGSMYRRVRACGGKVKGLLWYQGESNANPETCDTYKARMKTFIKAVRKDFKAPQLPFLIAQIGRFFVDETQFPPAPWDLVQQAQLALEDELAHVGVVATLDGTLSDAIHLDARSERQLGSRFAELALVMAYGHKGGQALYPDLVRCTDMHRAEIRIRYRNVRERLSPSKNVWGFIVEDPDGKRIHVPEATTSGNSVVLRLERSAPKGTKVWYARGTNTTTNLHDAVFAAPAFGPVVV